jgi:hypothetical protein
VKTLSVLLTFVLLIAANALAARMARVNALPAARKTAMAQQWMHPTNFVPAGSTSNVSHHTNLHEEKL